jgi:hypothetical protein
VADCVRVPPAFAEATAGHRSLVRLRAKRYGETSPKLERAEAGAKVAGLHFAKVFRSASNNTSEASTTLASGTCSESLCIEAAASAEMMAGKMP